MTWGVCCVYFRYMTKQVLNIKVDSDTKREVKKLAEDFGLPISVLVNAQLRQLLRERRVELVAPYNMSPLLEKKLAIVEQDLVRGKNLSPVFDSLKAMDRYLDSQ